MALLFSSSTENLTRCLKLRKNELFGIVRVSDDDNFQQQFRFRFIRAVSWLLYNFHALADN